MIHGPLAGDNNQTVSPNYRNERPISGAICYTMILIISPSRHKFAAASESREGCCVAPHEFQTCQQIVRNERDHRLIKNSLPLRICTLTLAALALDGVHVYSPESLCTAFWMRSRLVVTWPFSVTRLIPPLGESKLITWALWAHNILGGGSGAKRTKQVKFIVEPMFINKSGPPRISVIGSGTKRHFINYFGHSTR